MAVTDSSGASADALRTVAKRVDKWMKRTIAANPRAPSDVPESLAQDRDYDVRRLAADTLAKRVGERQRRGGVPLAPPP